MSGSHDHAHARHGRGRGAARRALWFSVVANSTLLVTQVVVGLVTGSLALLADSLHNASDVVALLVALVAHGLAARPATERRTYGLARAEILAAFVNGAALMALTAWIVIEAVRRLSDAPEVTPAPLAVIGLLGIAVNGGSAWLLARQGDDSLNIRAAFWHLAADALGSLGVVVAAIGLAWFDAAWADPAASILISVLVLVGVWRLLKDTIDVLLESTPAGVDVAAVTADLEGRPGVVAVHHLHIWSLDSQTVALTAHLTLEDGTDLHRAQEIADDCRAVLHERHDIDHVTLEPECHECGAPGH